MSCETDIGAASVLAQKKFENEKGRSNGPAFVVLDYINQISWQQEHLVLLVRTDRYQ